MRQKKFFVSVLFFSFVLMFLASPTIFANVEGSTIDIDDTNYIEVSEEEVIKDFMQGKGVDRETAKKELGITSTRNKLKGNEYSIMASCSTSWRLYNSNRKVIDSLSRSYLTLHPYINVQVCTNPSTISFVGLSQNISHTVSSDFKGGVKFSGNPYGGLNGTTSVSVGARGTITNFLGIKLRDWSYTDRVNAVNTGGGGRPF